MLARSAVEVRLYEVASSFGLVADDVRSNPGRPKSTTSRRHLEFGASAR